MLQQERRSVELGVCPMQLLHLWSRDVHPVPNLLLCTKFHENLFLLQYGENGSRPPSWNCFTTIRDHPRSLCCWPQLPVKFHVIVIHIDMKCQCVSHWRGTTRWWRLPSRRTTTSSQHARPSGVLRRRSDGLECAAWRPPRPVAQCRQFPEEAKDASVSECTWTLRALEALRNALYKFKTYLLTYLQIWRYSYLNFSHFWLETPI